MTLRKLAVTVVLVGAAAGATTLVSLDVAGLTKSSDVIVRGTVKSVAPRWTKDHARIITDAELDVAETYKGSVGKTVIAMQPGGELGEVGQRVDGVAVFKPGEEVVVFLEARGDRFTVTGMLQGRFAVERSSDGKSITVRGQEEGMSEVIDPVTKQYVGKPPVSMSLDELKRQVRLALDTPHPLPKGTGGVAPTVTP